MADDSSDDTCDAAAPVGHKDRQVSKRFVATDWRAGCAAEPRTWRNRRALQRPNGPACGGGPGERVRRYKVKMCECTINVMGSVQNVQKASWVQNDRTMRRAEVTQTAPCPPQLSHGPVGRQMSHGPASSTASSVTTLPEAPSMQSVESGQLRSVHAVRAVRTTRVSSADAVRAVRAMRTTLPEALSR